MMLVHGYLYDKLVRAVLYNKGGWNEKYNFVAYIVIFWTSSMCLLSTMYNLTLSL